MKKPRRVVKNRTFLWVTTLLLYAYPALLVGSLYWTWCVAWVALGHRPRPSLDDPKYISTLVDIPYAATMLMLIGCPGAAMIGVAMTPVSMAYSIRSKSRVVVATVAGLLLLAVLWCATVMFLRTDPWNVGDWFMD